MRKHMFVPVALCLLLIITFVSGGCSDSDSIPDEATATETKASAVTDTSGNATTTSIVAGTAEATKATENYVTVTEADDETPSNCTVNVDGKTYDFSVGDTFRYVYNLKTPEALEDFQATTNYDSGMLELIESDSETMFPVAGKVVVYNTELQNTIKYNAVDINGMDFTKGGVLVSFTFRILDGGGTAIGTTLEYMDSVKSEPYVSDYKIVGDIEYSEEVI